MEDKEKIFKLINSINDEVKIKIILQFIKKLCG